METITNVEVSKVFKGKSGEGQYGPWQIWDVYFNGDNRKFTYFEKGNVIPEVGMMVLVLKFDVEKKGQYTNYTVKELTPDPNWWSGKEPEIPHRTPQNAAGSTFSQNKGGDIGPMTMWGKYIGEVISALIGKGLIGKDLDDAAKDAMETFADCCIVFERQYSNVIELPKPTDKIVDPTVHEPEDPDEPPLPEPPPY